MPQSRIVVGVIPGQPEKVLREAAELARDLDAELVCAYVDVSRYAAEFLPNGFMVSMPIDPEVTEGPSDQMPQELAEHIDGILPEYGITWSTRGLAGDPAGTLGKLAEEIDARLIVVGTREPGFLATIEEIVTGAVAAHLAHKQPRPVVVVPLAPRGDTEKAARKHENPAGA